MGARVQASRGSRRRREEPPASRLWAVRVRPELRFAALREGWYRESEHALRANRILWEPREPQHPLPSEPVASKARPQGSEPERRPKQPEPPAAPMPPLPSPRPSASLYLYESLFREPALPLFRRASAQQTQTPAPLPPALPEGLRRCGYQPRSAAPAHCPEPHCPGPHCLGTRAYQARPAEAERPAAEPPAEGPPAEGPPAEGPPAEGPPAEGPPAEGPPVSSEHPEPKPSAPARSVEALTTVASAAPPPPARRRNPGTSPRTPRPPRSAQHHLPAP